MIGRRGVALLAALLLAGCSSSAPKAKTTVAASTVAGVQTIHLSAGSDLRFTPSMITIHPGKVNVILTNTGGAPHDFSLMGFPADFVPLATSGMTSQATFVAPAPGRYTFVCTIHEAQGQTGTLIVLPQ